MSPNDTTLGVGHGKFLDSRYDNTWAVGLSIVDDHTFIYGSPLYWNTFILVQLTTLHNGRMLVILMESGSISSISGGLFLLCYPDKIQIHIRYIRQTIIVLF